MSNIDILNVISARPGKLIEHQRRHFEIIGPEPSIDHSTSRSRRSAHSTQKSAILGTNVGLKALFPKILAFSNLLTSE